MSLTNQHPAAFMASLRVLRRLREAGHEAFIAGGAVRDMILGTTAKDFDIATSATPDVVTQLFEKTIAVGAQFGVICVLVEAHEVEVATFRTETGYADGRRPDSVEWSSAREDVLRRDFTINGLLWDPLAGTGKGEVIDHVEGRVDLEAGVVRAIGDPTARFREDRLRILRAIRFAARLNFEVEARTWQALVETAEQIKSVSAERIMSELERMLTGPAPGRAWSLLHEANLTQYILPEVSEPERVEARLRHCAHLTSEQAWVLVLLDTNTQITSVVDAWSKRLKTSRALAQHVRKALTLSQQLLGYQSAPLAQRKRMVRDPAASSALFALSRAAEAGQHDSSAVDTAKEDTARWEDSSLWPVALLNGRDIVALGHPKGPMLGETIRALEDGQLEGEICDRPGAEAFIKSRVRSTAAD